MSSATAVNIAARLVKLAHPGQILSDAGDGRGDARRRCAAVRARSNSRRDQGQERPRSRSWSSAGAAARAHPFTTEQAHFARAASSPPHTAVRRRTRDRHRQRPEPRSPSAATPPTTCACRAARPRASTRASSGGATSSCCSTTAPTAPTSRWRASTEVLGQARKLPAARTRAYSASAKRPKPKAQGTIAFECC